MQLSITTVDSHNPQALAAFYAELLKAPITNDWGEYVLLGSTPPMGFQKVAEPTPGKNRVHLEFHVPNREKEVERAAALGAEVGQEHTIPGIMTWTVLYDPEGNVFSIGQKEEL